MARFRYQVLAPNRRYCLGRNPKTGQLDYFDCKPEHTKHLAVVGSAMLSAGVPVPVCWEHDDRMMPGKRLSANSTAKEKALATAGQVSSYELDSADVLWANAEIPNDVDAAKAKVVRFCSPWIHPDVIDGDGTEWGVAVAHLALTPRPINHHQPAAVALSVAGKLWPQSPMRFALDPEKGTDMADETKDPPVDPPAPKAEDKPPEEKKPDAPKEEDKLPSDAGGKLKEALAWAAKFDLMLGDDTTVESFLDRFVVACSSKWAAENALDDDPFPGDDLMDPTQAPKPEQVQPGLGNGGSPVLMSKLVENERGEVGKRLARLLKASRITPAEHTEKTKELTGIKMACDAATGNITGHERLLGWIEGREAMGKGTAFPLTSKDNPAGAALSANGAVPVDPPAPDKAKEDETAREDARREARRVSRSK